MATRQTITDEYLLTTRVQDGLTAGLQAGERALDSFDKKAAATAQSIQATGGAINDTGGRILQATSSFDRLSGKYDDVTKAANRLQSAQAELQRVQSAYAREVANGTADKEAHGRVVAALGDKITVLATRLGQARAEAAANAEAEERWTGIVKQGSAAVEQHAAAIADAAQAGRLITSSGRDQAAIISAVGTTSKAAALATRDLALQSVDFFEQVATGQPILRSFLQQASQVYQVNLATGTSMKDLASSVGTALASAFRAVISPIGLAVAGFGALAGAAALVLSHAGELADEQRQLSVALTASGKAADTSAASFQGYVAALKAAGASSSDALAVATSLARNRNLSTSEAGTIATLAPDLSAATGGSVVDAAKQLADIAGGSTDAIRRLNDALGILSPSQEAAAVAAAEHGDKLSAMRQVVDALAPRIQGLTDQGLSPAAKAMRDLSNAWDTFINAVAQSEPAARVLQGVVNTLNAIGGASDSVNLAKLTGQLADLQGQAASIRSDIAAIPEGLKGTDATRDLQHQLEGVQQQAAAVQKSIDAITSKGHTLPTLTVSPSQEQQRSLDIARLAAQRAEASDAGQAQKYRDEISKFRDELTKLGPKTAENATLFNQLTGAIQADEKALADIAKRGEQHASALDKQKATLDAQIAAQRDLAAAYGEGAGAVRQVLAEQAAEKEVISAGLTPGTQKFADAVHRLTDEHLRLAEATAQADFAKELAGLKDAADAADKIAAAYDGTAESITAAQNQVRAAADASKAYAQGSPQYLQAVNDEATALDRASAANARLQQQQQSVASLTNIASQAFDQVGEAIVNAFVSGQGAAVNFGNVMKGVLSSVLQQLARLAILNPILNSLFGGTARPTLASALGVMGGIPAEGGGLGIVSNLGAIGRAFTGQSLSSGIDQLGAQYLPGLFGASTSNATLLTSDLGGITAGTQGVQGGGLLSGLGPFGALSNVLGVLGAAIPGLIRGNFAQAALGTVGAGAGLAAGSALGSLAGIGLGPVGLPAGGIKGNLLHHIRESAE